ncbi:MAG: hypothetical protein M1813_006323 [Trichoglossum hirsutum]|nr:MAG: hypothetical protein M1813_006323 [Trichoglossum hirsutum]
MECYGAGADPPKYSSATRSSDKGGLGGLGGFKQAPEVRARGGIIRVILSDNNVGLQDSPLPSESSLLPTKLASNSSETKLRMRVLGLDGSIDKVFPVDTTLAAVAEAVGQEAIISFVQVHPRKVHEEADFDLTLKKAGLVPNTALTLKWKEGLDSTRLI